MEKKLMSFKTKGMNQDLSVSAFNPEFSFENHNLRLSTNEGNTLMSWVNEKGTLPLKFDTETIWDSSHTEYELQPSIKGTPIGKSVINNTLVLFTHNENKEDYPDHIYAIKYSNEDKTKIKCLELFNGFLNFNIKYPIETINSYEREDIIKVYWVDGINQPRIINIGVNPKNYKDNSGYPINNSFDFVQELNLDEEVTVTKVLDAGGNFSAGVIQYAFSYIKENTQESNIFHITPLHYISHEKRGANKDESVQNAFKIKVENVDTSYDSVRIYSIIRTSLNGDPIVKRVQDVKINKQSDIITETPVNDIFLTFNIFSDNFAVNTTEYTDNFVSINTLVQTEKYVKLPLPAPKVPFDQEDSNVLPKAFIFDKEWNNTTVQDVLDLDFESDYGVQISYEYDYDNKTATVIKVTNDNIDYRNAYHVAIPSTVTVKDKQNITVIPGKIEHLPDNPEYEVQPLSIEDDEITLPSNQIIDIGGTYTVTKIAATAFEDITNEIDWLRIPETVEEIENETLYNKSIENIYCRIPADKINKLQANQIFQFDETKDRPTRLIVPNGAKDAYIKAGFTGRQSEEGDNYLFEELITEEEYVANDPRFDDSFTSYYRFTKQGFPNLVIKDLLGNMYTWGKEANGTAVIYIFPNYTKFTNGNNPLLPTLICEHEIDGEWVPVHLSQVITKSVNVTLNYTDTNNSGDVVDMSKLLLSSTGPIIAKTLNQKDGTLFFGNIELSEQNVKTLKGLLQENSGISVLQPIISKNIQCTRIERPYALKDGRINTLWCPENVLDSKGNNVQYQGASCFKSWEYYRLGLQFQHASGSWSEPIWIGDKQWTLDKWEPLIYGIGPLHDESGNNGNFMTKGIGVLAVPEFLYTLPSTVQEDIMRLGYKRVRAVYALPSANDRTVICQGVLNPTMYRNTLRQNGNTYASSSWLFRARMPGNGDCGYRDYIPASTSGSLGGCVEYKGALPTIYIDDETVVEGVEYDYAAKFNEFDTSGNYDTIFNKEVWMPFYASTEVMGYYDDDNKYRIDNLFLTLHSPDIEFGDVADDRLVNCSLHSIGYSLLSSTVGHIQITTHSGTISGEGKGTNVVMRHFSTKGTSALISGNYYNDCIVYCDNDYNYEALNYSTAVYWPVFMWHKEGSLNNDVKRDNRSANLKTKIISNYRRCDTTLYTQDIIKPTLDIRIFNGTESSSLIKLNNKYIYKGCIEDALQPERSSFYFVGEPLNEEFSSWQPTQYSLPIMKIYQKDKDNVDSGNWTYLVRFKDNQDSDWYATTVPKSGNFYKIEWDSLGNDYDDLGKQNKNLSYFEELVRIKYRSSPHMVINLQGSDYPNEALCDWSLDGSGFPFKKVTGDFGFTTIINSQVHPHGALPLAEIRRPYNSATFFGGTSDDAFQNIIWIPCGPSIRMNGNTDIKIPYKWGDSYYQRFECLKTYPYTEVDINQVVEVGSFYLESRVNLDGRYDEKIGDTNALYTRPTNFNLINSVYSQQDNIFSGRILPDTYHKTNVYSNQIVWTETKEEAGNTDLWTNINSNSVLSLDGSCGKINKIVKYNNTLYVFQDTGIAQILYNESTQLSTTAGVPVEIANSGKVNGVRYISSVIGCSDKSLTTVTPNGIYFVGSISKSVYLLNEQGLTNISNKFGFTTWCYNNFPNLGSTWNSNFSKDTDNDTIHKDTVLYYDKINQEVLFINKKTALVFSEKVGAFTSFYDYGNTPYFCNLEDTGLWIKPDSTLWKHQAGEYCNFFGKEKPYGMILVGNPEPQADKMFTNLEFRAYADEDDVTPFDSLTTWNEYQEGSYTFTNNMKNASFLSKKFRMWRCNIPRDRKHIMDRMRGPWLYLKLEKNTDTSSRVEIHDIAMTYYK